MADIAASQAAAESITEVVQELNNSFKEMCIKSAYNEVSRIRETH